MLMLKRLFRSESTTPYDCSLIDYERLAHAGIATTLLQKSYHLPQLLEKNKLKLMKRGMDSSKDHRQSLVQLLVSEINSGSVIKGIERYLTTPNLLPDPHGFDGGLIEWGKNKTDRPINFRRQHPETALFRRATVIIAIGDLSVKLDTECLKLKSGDGFIYSTDSKSTDPQTPSLCLSNSSALIHHYYSCQQ